MQNNNELLEAFLQAHKDWGHSPRTIQTYREILSDFLGKISDPLTVKYPEIEQWVSQFRHLSVNTQNLKRATLKSFFKWLRVYDHRPDDPAEKLRTIKSDQGQKTKYVPEEDFRRIVNKVKSRDRIMYSLGYRCGLRLSEILSLTRDSLHIDHKTLEICGKGNKTRYVPVPDGLWQEIMLYLESFPITYHLSPITCLFATRAGKKMDKSAFYSVWRSRMRKLGMDYNPHALRHGCATRWLEKGANIREIQDLLGHSSINTTQRYTHIVSNKLRELVNKET